MAQTIWFAIQILALAVTAVCVWRTRRAVDQTRALCEETKVDLAALTTERNRAWMEVEALRTTLLALGFESQIVWLDEGRHVHVQIAKRADRPSGTEVRH